MFKGIELTLCCAGSKDSCEGAKYGADDPSRSCSCLRVTRCDLEIERGEVLCQEEVGGLDGGGGDYQRRWKSWCLNVVVVISMYSVSHAQEGHVDVSSWVVMVSDGRMFELGQSRPAAVAPFNRHHFAQSSSRLRASLVGD